MVDYNHVCDRLFLNLKVRVKELEKSYLSLSTHGIFDIREEYQGY
ncbi:hypothetical protein JOD43_002984 [Pullulanibacillus pueri]|uniref:Uncharacterized protein n=1 Tax=Pullulanibacillus pueri TaxID=1437324 RepID=A0A8J3EML1_9BACL|nr:hypothetical protein [Pullulanibacillus pueri]GGH83254.1 hypothetical protein GCM10007096_23850 [Pullulanibacillus pueri]